MGVSLVVSRECGVDAEGLLVAHWWLVRSCADNDAAGLKSDHMTSRLARRAIILPGTRRLIRSGVTLTWYGCD